MLAIGWWPKALGDLTGLLGSQTLRYELKRMLAEQYPNTPQVTGKSASEINSFLKVFGRRGSGCRRQWKHDSAGVGRIESNSQYRYEPTDHFPHRRARSYLAERGLLGPPATGGLTHNLPGTEDSRESCCHRGANRRRHAKTCCSCGCRWCCPSRRGPTQRIRGRAEFKACWNVRGQVILYGPPGTGKSFWADRTARDLTALREFGQLFAALDTSQKSALESGAFVRACTFHPAYGYEDFLEGYRPQSLSGQLVFSLRDGIFKRLCGDARQNSGSNYYPHRRRN